MTDIALTIIVPPTECPSCDSELELVKDQLFCRNNSCTAKTSKQVEHFVKTMKIKGFGPKTIEKLGLESILELYSLTEEHLVSIMGKTMGAKLYATMDSSRTPDADVFFAAFSVPLFGKTAATKVAQFATTFDDITPSICAEAKLGPKLTESLLDWIETVWKEQQYDSLLFEVAPQGMTVSPTVKPIKDLGLNVVITGKLDNFKNRTEAGAYLSSLGFTIKSSVNKTTNYLINEEGRSSSSTKKADSLGVMITTIDELTTQHEI
jgi:NAD-dependent DNA ligase